MRRGLPIIGFCVLLLSFGDVKAQEAFVNSITLYSTNQQQLNSAPVDTAYSIREIVVIGNKRTRKSTILRELPFKKLDSYTYPELIEKLEVSKRQLMNTNLFRNVIIALQKGADQQVFVSVDVEEKWYFFPQPFVRLANGTFSQWNERGRPLEHLNYGLKLTQFNFTGRDCAR